MALQLTIPNMACASCLDTITKAVKRVDPDARVEAELGTKAKQVKIETQASELAIRDVLAKAGYAPA